MDSSKVYYLVYRRPKRNSAGSKAPADIAEICRREGFHPLCMPEYSGREGTLFQKLWLLTVAVFRWWRNTRRLPRDAVVIYQHPAYGMRVTMWFVKRLRRKKNCRFVAVIHDLESLRGGISGVITNYENAYSFGDQALLRSFDAVICHNRKMAEYLVHRGFAPEKLIPLELFDYLTPVEPSDRTRGEEPSVAIAGFLAAGKSGYIYRLYEGGHNPGLAEYLYGNGFNPEETVPGIRYQGSFPPDELPAHLIGDFGLVWDGPSAETCTGNTGEYLKFNNPHKTSLYLAAGLPVIVWSRAAVVDFVLREGAGIAVDSLYDLENAVRAVPDGDYRVMCENARAVSAKLREGGFFRAALAEALRRT